jgi:lysyl-tRNA synthetase class II
MQLSEQEIIRREKLNKLTEMGINAFPADEYTITDTTESIKQDFSESKQVKIAGRLMSRRIQGKASFAELQDSKGKFRFTSTETKSVRVKIKNYTTKCTNTFWILVILSVLKENCLRLR